MSVNVAPGQAWTPGTLGAAAGIPAAFTSQGSYYGYNDGVDNLTVAASNTTNARIDLVVLSVQDSYYSGAANQSVVQMVTGIPAVTPAAPATPASSIVLAQVLVPAASTSIVGGDITDERPFVSLATPAVSAALAKLPGRLQSGSNVITTNSSGQGTITFPTAFASAPNVVAGIKANSSLLDVDGGPAATTTSFVVQVLTAAGAAAGTGLGVQINWIAAGT